MSQPNQSLHPNYQAQQGPTYQQPTQPQGGYYSHGQYRPNYSQPQGSNYRPQQPGYTYTQQLNPNVAYTGPTPNQGLYSGYQPPYASYQQPNQAGYTTYTPYGQNPAR